MLWRFLIAVVVMGVLLSSPVGACAYVSTYQYDWWAFLDILTWQDVGTWVTWWYDSPVCIF